MIFITIKHHTYHSLSLGTFNMCILSYDLISLIQHFTVFYQVFIDFIDMERIKELEKQLGLIRYDSIDDSLLM